MLRIVIGLQNYNGVACGVNFEKSIGQNIPEDWTVEHVQVKRLLALFPGTTVEDVAKGTPVGADDEKVKADLEAARKADHAAKAAAESELTPQPETVETAEEVLEAELVEKEAEEVAEEVEELEEPEDEEKKPLESGDTVLAHYKGEFRKGKVVKVLESGVVRVKIDGDDANYRVLDDDKVSKLDT